MRTRRTLAAGLAAFAIAATGLVSTTLAPNAVAGETAQCYASTVTLTKTDVDTGATLTDARFNVTLPEGVYALAGDAKDQSAAFKAAFDAAAPDFYANAAGVAWNAAQQDTLGTTFVGYPVDITDLTDTNIQPTAMSAWQEDRDGKVADFRADAQARLDAVNAALAANPTLETVDPDSYAHAVAVRDGLAKVVAGVDEALAATDWAAFTTAYDKLSDAANWHYGLAREVSVEYKDSVTGADFAAMNAAGAQAIGATDTLNVATGADGTVSFTVFGVKDGYLDAGTRGDVSCSQLAGSVTETVAPAGYTLDPTARDWASSTLEAGAVASLTVTNKAFVSTVPDVPVRTSTGA